MKGYDTYRIEIEPLSSFLTPFHSDTIFGHMVWALSDLYGKDEADSVVRRAIAGRPDFIFSNAFQRGHLPKINNMNPETMMSEIVEMAMQNEPNRKKATVEVMKLFKSEKKKNTISIDEFDSLRQKSARLYYYSKISQKDEDDSGQPFYKEIFTPKNSVNRLDGSTVFPEEKSGLYGITETYYCHPLTIYVRISHDYSFDKLSNALRHIEATGFGKKKSSGKGVFRITEIERTSVFDKEIDGANAYILLSNYVPAENDYEEVFYSKIETKRGKVSGGYIYRDNIFKKPVTYYVPGTIFLSPDPGELKGRCLENISDIDEVVQFMTGFTVEVKI